jgi:mannose-6-phosphate isomerase-like protein (cupin superfamily)
MTKLDSDPSGAVGPGVLPEVISLRTQLVSAGHTKTLLAQTDLVTFHLHCYAPGGGENGLHAHTGEDHIFVALQGEANFRSREGELPTLRKHQAIVIPRGSFYSFSNDGTEPLVLVRFGASRDKSDARLDPEGKPIPGRSQKPGAATPVLIENAFFE